MDKGAQIVVTLGMPVNEPLIGAVPGNLGWMLLLSLEGLMWRSVSWQDSVAAELSRKSVDTNFYVL